MYFLAQRLLRLAFFLQYKSMRTAGRLTLNPEPAVMCIRLWTPARTTALAQCGDWGYMKAGKLIALDSTTSHAAATQEVSCIKDSGGAVSCGMTTCLPSGLFGSSRSEVAEDVDSQSDRYRDIVL